jgi:TonB family protein
VKSGKRYTAEYVSFFIALAVHGLFLFLPKAAEEGTISHPEPIAVHVRLTRDIPVPEVRNNEVLREPEESPPKREHEGMESPGEKSLSDEANLPENDLPDNAEPIEAEARFFDPSHIVPESVQGNSPPQFTGAMTEGGGLDDAALRNAGIPSSGERGRERQRPEIRGSMKSGEGTRPSFPVSGGRTSAARPLSMIEPEYPKTARQRGIEGTVRILAVISPSGRVEAEVKESSGFALLDQAALASVLKTEFEPATVDGIPVRSSVLIPLRFVLEEDE